MSKKTNPSTWEVQQRCAAGMSEPNPSVAAKVARMRAERLKPAERLKHCCEYHEDGGYAMNPCVLPHPKKHHKALADLIDAARTFVRRCEAGEIRSRRTYGELRDILARLDGTDCDPGDCNDSKE